MARFSMKLRKIAKPTLAVVVFSLTASASSAVVTAQGETELEQEYYIQDEYEYYDYYDVDSYYSYGEATEIEESDGTWNGEVGYEGVWRAEEVDELYEDEEDEEEENTPAYFRTTANLRLRTGPSLDDDIIRLVPEGSTVRVYDHRDGEWFSVSHNGTMGFMYAEFLALIPAVVQVTEDRPGDPVVNPYGVELVDWSEVRHNLVRNGVPLHVTDVRTGTTFWMVAFSQGRHADVVPLTSSDTEALRSAFGGRWSWEPRAIWVTVDGRTFAASMSGMPHGSSNNRDNGMVGHVCMHFQGSRTHNGNRSHERDHQNRVQEAFNAAR